MQNALDDDSRLMPRAGDSPLPRQGEEGLLVHAGLPQNWSRIEQGPDVQREMWRTGLRTHQAEEEELRQ